MLVVDTMNSIVKKELFPSLDGVFPGENRRIRIRCSFQDVQAIRLDINQNLYSRYTMSLRLKDQQDLPLSQISESFTWKETEEKAAQLAQFLRIPIEGI